MCLDLKVVEIRAAKNDPGVRRSRQQANPTADCGVQAYAVDLNGALNCELMRHESNIVGTLRAERMTRKSTKISYLLDVLSMARTSVLQKYNNNWVSGVSSRKQVRFSAFCVRGGVP